MASIYADPKLRNKRHYIAASSFNTVLYTYTASLNDNLVRVGSLGATAGATAGNCPQGRILRENGSRLYPDANPGISTLMVGVYDANSGLKGYIDPNAPQFAVFNSDKPVEMVDGGDNNTTTPHKGQPVFTTGDVIANGNAIIGGYIASSYVAPQVTASAPNNNTYVDARTGNYFVANLTYTAGGAGTTYLYFGTGTGDQVVPADGQVISVAIYNTTGSAQTVVINQTYKSVQGYSNNPGIPIATIPNGQVRTFTFVSDGTTMYLTNAGNITSSSGIATLSSGAVTVADRSVTTSSRIFLTATTNVNLGTLRVSAQTANTGFVITSSSGTDGSAVSWMIVN